LGEGDVPALLDKVAYFADERLSENIDVTPEGYLICRNAVIGRTGFQTYKVSEIADPEGLLGDQGRNPDDKIDLWRDASEVFSAATIASFEGKTFTFTHPDQLLDPDTEKYHHAGHVQNVRRGEPLDTGDIPLLADIIVTDRGAIEAIRNGDRELSCGYTYKLAKHGADRWDQTQILGNHVALVQKGRAGSEARIYDADPEHKTGFPQPKFGSSHVAAMRVPKGGSSCTSCKYLADNGVSCNERGYIEWHSEVTGKENDSSLGAAADEFCSDWYEPKPGAIRDTAADSWWKEKPMTLLQRILGMGMKEFAKDAKPEELAAALNDNALTVEKKEDDKMLITIQHNGNGNHRNGKRRLQSIGFTKDGVEIFKALDAEGTNAKAPAASELTLSGTGNDDDDDRRGKDDDDNLETENKSAMDRRKRMHDLLDEVLGKSESSQAARKAEKDADVGELKKLMGEYLGEEAGEKQHVDKAADDDDDDDKGRDALPPQFAKKADDEEEEADDDEEEKKADDDDDDDDKAKDAEIVRAEPKLEEGQTPKNPVSDRVVFDAAATMTLLKAFRPIVASSNDKRVRAAFDTLYQGLRRAAKKGSTGRDSYARVIKASGKVAGDKVSAARDAEPKRPKESVIQKEVREADQVYADAMKKHRNISAEILEKHRSKT
jgi:hypothetical protein